MVLGLVEIQGLGREVCVRVRSCIPLMNICTLRPVLAPVGRNFTWHVSSIPTCIIRYLMIFLSLVLVPTEKPGYFSFFFTGNGREYPDIPKLVEDEEALREAFRERIERNDLVFGKFEAVSSWK